MNIVLFYDCNGPNAEQFFDAIKGLSPDSFVNNFVSDSDREVRGVLDSDRTSSQHTCSANLVIIEMSRVLLPQTVLDRCGGDTFGAFVHFIRLMLKLIKLNSKVIFYGTFSDTQVSKLNALRKRYRNFHYSERDCNKLIAEIQKVINR